MEKEWIYDKDPDSEYEKKIFKSILKLTKNKDLAQKGAKNLGLFNFLKTNKFSNADELYNSIFLDSAKKEHFFSNADSKKVFEFFNTTGGGDESAYDALIDRWLNFMFYMTPDMVQQQLSFLGEFAFPLRTLEDIPGAGQALGFSVDVVAQGNKIVAKLAQQYTPMIMGIFPLPEASTVGIIVGYMISTMFIFFNMLIFVSRHHFGEAFTQSLALFPFIGLALQSFAESGDKLVEKFAAKREKLIAQLKTGMFSPLGVVIENWTFDPMDPGDAKERAEAFKSSIQGHVDNIKNATKEFADPVKREALLRIAKGTATQEDIANHPNFAKTREQAQGHIETANTKFEELKAHPELQKNIGTLNTAVDTAKQRVTEFKKTLQGKQAGKRLSRRKRVKGKWATQRQSVK